MDNLTKILVIDDNAVYCELVIRRLQRAGFDAYGAKDGNTALAITASNPPDLILLDIELGDVDGWEVATTLKNTPGTSAIPIIILSADASAEARTQAQNCGCQDFEAKPFEMARLLDKVNACIDMQA